MRIKKEFNLQHVIEGAYYPGVFIIKIDKVLREGIQYDDFGKEDWQTFVHEYVHFLQDISTSHGYLYYFHKSQLFNLCFYVLQANTCFPLYIHKTSSFIYIMKRMMCM